MNSDNIISVIVITYNQQDTIGRTLDSILMQQCHLPIEIVIGEDCSTDNTLAVCREYQSRYPDQVRVLANKENRGPANNYFDCMLQCSGRYIGDCAGDDFWNDPLKLEKEVSIMESHPNVTLVHTSWYNYDETTHSTTEGPQQPFTDPITKGSDMLEAIVTQTSVPVVHLCTSLYRKDIVLSELSKDKYMFRNPDYGCEDLQVAFVEALHGDIAYLSERTLNYSIGHESVSSPGNLRKMFNFSRKMGSLSHYLAEKYGIHSAATEDYFRQRIFALGMHAFRLHDPTLLQETLKYEQEWNVSRNGRIRLLFFVMRHRGLWQLALMLRSILLLFR